MTLSTLQIFLLGPPRFERDGRPLEISRRKVTALLAYLATTGEAHRREELAALFWPDYDESRAFAYLRRTLWSLKKVLGDEWLAVDRENIDLARQPDLWIDVEHFQQLLANSQTQGQPAGDNLTTLTEAVALYRDDFLTGFTLPDNPEFDEWQFFQTESLRQKLAAALEQLIHGYTALNDFETAIAHARRWSALDPLHEPAHQQLMQLYAWIGQQSAALRQYQICVQTLDKELGISPLEETISLYEIIKTRRLPSPAAAEQRSSESLALEESVSLERRSQTGSELEPAPLTDSLISLEDEEAPENVKKQVFVARDRELDQLNKHLEATLSGQGRVVFITGSAGRGKTALLAEFAGRAQADHPNLIVANGQCNTYSGIGDPYLPFRDVLEMFSGNVDSSRAGHIITPAHARRLQRLFPQTIQALVDDGPDLLDVFVSGTALLTRAASISKHPDWLEPLRAQAEHTRKTSTSLAQSDLFEQYTRVLHRLAGQQPLLITLDDVQWADTASLSLLFHLGRRLAGQRILIVATYRPEEAALGRPVASNLGQVQRHPLEKLVAEFKRTFGDIHIDLTNIEALEGWAFVDAFLDTQPNRLSPEFRQALFSHTGGHPLFTIELLRAMQSRGDLIQDETGQWIEGPALDWDTLPAKVEGVIEERIGRLEPELREVLSVASVQGEDFTVEVLAHVQQVKARSLLRDLSHALEKRHRLVREQEPITAGPQIFSRYQFSHILFQRYLYNNLSAGERRLLHGEVAQALEHLYPERPHEIIMQLAHHYLESGEQEKAAEHLHRAGDQARRVMAMDEAACYYHAALERWPSAEQVGRADVMFKHAESLWFIGALQESRQIFEAAYSLYQTLGNPERAGACQRLIGRIYWELGERELSLRHSRKALSILEGGPESVELAWAMSAISQLHMLASEYDQTCTWGEQALELADRLGAEDVAVHTLNNIGTACFHLGEPERGEALLTQSLERALALNMPQDAARAYANLSEGLMWKGRYAEAQRKLEEAHAYATRTHTYLAVNAARVRLAEIDWFTGRWGSALPKLQQARAHIGQTQPVGYVKILVTILSGWIHNDLGQAHLARQVLEQDLPVARSSNELQTTVPYLAELARAYDSLGLENKTEELLHEILSWIDRAPYLHSYDSVPLLFACQWWVNRATPDALETAQNALRHLERLSKQMGITAAEASLNEGQGSLALAKENDQLAVDYLRHAVERWKATGRPYDQMRALKGLGDALLQSGDTNDAGNAFKQALEIVDSLASQLEETEIKTSFLNSSLVQQIHNGANLATWPSENI